jgi:hypothetical protein
MIIKTTYANYIDNPGIIKGVSTNTQMKLIKADYKKRFDALIVREAGEMAYYLYKDTKESNRYYAHIMVPSESTKGIYYDVVIEFSTDKPEVMMSNLNSYNVKFFSNDPAFIFTYAYTFKHSGLTIDWLEKKMNKKALTDKPVIRNPRMQTGYIKSLYFAYYFMKLRRLFFAEESWKLAKPLNKANVLKMIVDSETKLGDIKRVKEIQKKIKEQERQDKAIVKDLTGYSSDNVKIAKRVSKVPTVGRLKSSIKTARTTSVVRRIGRKK